MPPFEEPQVPGVAGKGSLVAEHAVAGAEVRQYHVYCPAVAVPIADGTPAAQSTS